MRRKIGFCIKLLMLGSILMSLAVLINNDLELKLSVTKQTELVYEAAEWKPLIVRDVNQKKIEVYVDNQVVEGSFYMNDDLECMVPLGKISTCFNCNENFYQQKELVLQKADTVVRFHLDEPNRVVINDAVTDVAVGIVQKEDSIYVPASILAETFGYAYYWDVRTNMVDLVNQWNGSILPSAYNLQTVSRATVIKNQGAFSTCWAVASLSALETSLRPEEEELFSAEHMALHNSFSRDLNEGGEYTMSMAYLLAWQGPVREADDPYGDRQSPDDLTAVKHVQEIQLIRNKNLEKIKEAVFKYGAVQTSLFTSLKNSYSRSVYYNREKSAYCYIGTNEPNHDIIIIGWDDQYPKENFNLKLEKDGAFICQNSWGSNFGDQGIFYVSYEDSVIGNQNVVYTRIDETDNYDQIYQTDLCGWAGQIGYGKEMAFFANVFTPEKRESVRAVGFYATDEQTTYEVYKVPVFEGVQSFDQKELVASGTFDNPGFYTVDFKQPFLVESGQPFAVVVKIATPNAVHPVAVEYYQEDKIEEIDLTDGQGYLSPYGTEWSEVENEYQCNVCMKIYTDTMEE